LSTEELFLVTFSKKKHYMLTCWSIKDRFVRDIGVLGYFYSLYLS